MSLHAIIEYLKYRWKAKGRHGTHSPFVYAFVEDVVQGKAGHRVAAIDPMPQDPYGNLLHRIAAYYNYNSMLHIKNGDKYDDLKGQYDMIIFGGVASEWHKSIHDLVGVLSEGGVIVIPGIHQTAAATQCWDTICGDPSVKMSIDMYGVGLIFSRKEFKEKQHFVLKGLIHKNS